MMRITNAILLLLAVLANACGGSRSDRYAAVSEPVRSPVAWQNGVGVAADLPTARLHAEFDAMVRVANWAGAEFTRAGEGGMNSDQVTRYRLSETIERVSRLCGGLEYGREHRSVLASGMVQVELQMRPRVGMLTGADAIAACRRSAVLGS